MFIVTLFYFIFNTITVLLLSPLSVLLIIWVPIKGLLMWPWKSGCCGPKTSKELRGTLAGFQNFVVRRKYGPNIVAVAEFADTLPPSCAKKVAEMLQDYAPFKETIVSHPFGYSWSTPEAAWTPEETITHHTVQSKKDVNSFVAALDPAIAMKGAQWHLHHLDVEEDGKSVWVFVVSHTMGDGNSLLACLTSVFEEDEETDAAANAGGEGGADMPPRYKTARPSCCDRISAMCWALFSTLTMVLLPGDAKNDFKIPNRLENKIEWAVTPPIPVATLKRKSRLMKATINDLVMGAMAHCMAEMARDGKPVKTLRPRVDLIFNMRNLGKGSKAIAQEMRDGTAGIDIGHLFPRIVLDEGLSLQKRVTWIQAEVKRGALGLGHLWALWFVEACSYYCAYIAYTIVGMISDKISLFFSNLPGPKRTLRFEGHKMESLYNFVLPFEMGTGVSCLSYDEQFRVCVVADTGTKLSPQKLIDAMHALLIQEEA